MENLSSNSFATPMELEIVSLYRSCRYVEFWKLSESIPNSWLITYYRALCINSGLGIRANCEQARIQMLGVFPKIEEEACAGNPRAQHCLGWIHSNYAWGEYNADVAVKWFLRAAESGFVDSQFVLAEMYTTGRCVSRDLSKASFWYEKAAERGDCEAQYKVGEMCWDGRGRAADKIEAIKWFYKAATLGYSKAQFRIAECYFGWGDLHGAFLWFRKAAEAGCTEAQCCLAEYYDRGMVVPSDTAESISWYKKAAERGVERAKTRLSAEDGDPEARYSVAIRMEHLGEGDLAMKWYRMAAEIGHVKALAKLVEFYGVKDGTDLKQDEVFKWCWMAADRRVLTACRLMEEKKKSIKEAYRKQQIKEHRLCGLYDHTREYELESHAQITILRMAAELGVPAAQLRLGRCYEKGKWINRDDVEAFAWYFKAAKAGEVRAQDAVGWSYLNGFGVKRDLEQAVKWFRQSAGQGYAEAQWNLALCYYTGKGVTKDETEAVAWCFKRPLLKATSMQDGSLGFVILRGRALLLTKIGQKNGFEW